jgi:DNA-binding protein HU-beta
MNKSELVRSISQENSISRETAKKLVESVLTNIIKGTKNTGKVSLLGFGTFSVTTRKARKCMNPQTGLLMEVPAKEVVKFKPQF